MKSKKTAGNLTRLICMVLAVCMLAGIPVSKSEAAAVESGIDVSKYQGLINWAAVAQSGVTFAFIKVGSLKSGIDPYFYYNMLAAQAVGIKTGVYIYSYASNVQEAAIEAQFVLAALQNVTVSYPVAWDVEDDVQKNLSPDTIALMANTFCALVEAEGYHPIVYANKSWFTTKISTVYYDKWAAQWGTACEVPGASVWQYSSKGAIAGINGAVDLDFSLKDYSTDIVNTGWVARKGYLYFYINYKMQRGWLDLGAAKFYLDANGRMVTGWLTLADGIYYMQPTGVMSVGFTPIGNGIYYFDSNGRLQVGFQNIGGLYYYFAPNGVMYTGWLNDGVNIKYFDTDGHMAVGLVTIGDSIYFFDADGNMQTGIVDVAGTPLLFDMEGKLVIG